MFDLQNPQHLRERADALEAPEGTPIEIETDSGWLLVNEPIWAAHQRYRVKPAPTPPPIFPAKHVLEFGPASIDHDYYLLSADDILRRGDETTNTEGVWHPVSAYWLGQKVSGFPKFIFRRKRKCEELGDEALWQWDGHIVTKTQFHALQAIADAYEQGWRPSLPDCAEARHPDYQLPPLPDAHRFLKKHEYIQPGDLQWFGHGHGFGWQTVITSTVGLRYLDSGSQVICRKKQTV